ncbi:ComEC/Rec2 family competence protein [Pedobacter sp. MW01-1-1]|uniref:ComEC/Rec2 family competence protein n=1 Tax=Pedobacter sp. MW01-1-1 TaxID=3383027 RepID=UPI003FEE7CF4
MSALIVLVSLFLLHFFYAKGRFHRHKGIIGALFYSFFFLLGATICLLHNDKIFASYFGAKNYRYLKVRICDEAQKKNDIIRFKADVLSGFENQKEQRLTGKILLALKTDSLQPISLAYGDELLVVSSYTEVEPPYNPAEFDFKAWLAAQNIYHQAFVKQDNLLKTGNNKGNTFVSAALRVRNQQLATYRKLIKDDEAYAVASTLILGYRSNLDKDLLSAYSKTGTIHALSVSGAHVAIIYTILSFLFIFLDKKQSLKIIKLVCICTLIWGYALLTGMSPAVVRSAIMISIFITAKTFTKNRSGYNILAFSAFCALIYDPFMIWDVGFQLSYVAVFGLIYLQPKFNSLCHFKNQWVSKLQNFVALSLSAQLVTFPLSIYYFHQFPIYFLFANLAITIPLILMLYLGILVLIPGFGFLAPILKWIIVFTNHLLRGIANLPYSTVNSLWINLIQFICLSLALGCLIYAFDQRIKKFLFAALSIFILYELLIVYDDYRYSRQEKIIFFSLKKNYATAFIQGNEAVLVSDLKENDKNFIYFIKPALDQVNVRKIDFVPFNEESVRSYFVQKNYQIIFNDYKILLIDKSLNNKNFKVTGDFSSVWFHNNSKFELDSLTTKIKYTDLIIDGTNSDYRARELYVTSKNIGIRPHILKKNKAYLIELKSIR